MSRLRFNAGNLSFKTTLFAPTFATQINTRLIYLGIQQKVL